MKYQLVIQFSHESDVDFEKLIELEDVLEEKYNISGELDGHDVGCGQMNLFILTDDPIKAFSIIQSIIEQFNFQFKNMKAAYRDLNDECFICLWPEHLQAFEIV